MAAARRAVHHRGVNDDGLDDLATVPDPGEEPPRPSHGPRVLDAKVEEATWRELPPAPPPPPPRSAAPPKPRSGLRRRLGWWVLALLAAAGAAGAALWLQPEPPPCGERMFIPQSEGGTGCVDPALLKHNSR